MMLLSKFGKKKNSSSGSGEEVEMVLEKKSKEEKVHGQTDRRRTKNVQKSLLGLSAQVS